MAQAREPVNDVPTLARVLLTMARDIDAACDAIRAAAEHEAPDLLEHLRGSDGWDAMQALSDDLWANGYLNAERFEPDRAATPALAEWWRRRHAEAEGGAS